MILVTSDEMRRMDRFTIEELGIPGAVLMENAGGGCARVLCQKLGGVAGKRTAVLAGKGNNGGDGMVIARHLHNWGADVKVYLLSEKEKISGDARRNLDICLNSHVPVSIVSDAETFGDHEEDIKNAHVIVDALLGVGLSSEVKGFYRHVIEFVNRLNSFVVAVDVPSGVDATTGAVLGVAVKADLTVTFALPKRGLVLYPGAEFAGEVVVVDIGMPSKALKEFPVDTEIIEEGDLSPLLPPRRADAHKGDFGHLLVLAGSTGYTGAAALTCLGALKTGPGLVTLCVPESLNSIMEVKLTEVMTAPVPDEGKGRLVYGAIENVRLLIKGKDALAVGPGLSRYSETVELIREIVKTSPLPCVLDADGINAFEGRADEFKERSTDAPLVITPHPGEMARLTGLTTAQIQKDRVEVARNFAKEHGVVVVLKGARTVVAEPGGAVYVNLTGNPGMASGGMGDVLTGMIGGFMAQGVEAAHAARLSVYLHGKAGDVAADKGMAGIVAGDLLSLIPRLIEGLTRCEDNSRNIEPWLRHLWKKEKTIPSV